MKAIILALLIAISAGCASAPPKMKEPDMSGQWYWVNQEMPEHFRKAQR